VWCVVVGESVRCSDGQRLLDLKVDDHYYYFNHTHIGQMCRTPDPTAMAQVAGVTGYIVAGVEGGHVGGSGGEGRVVATQ
jgi:hypothetical protein